MKTITKHSFPLKLERGEIKMTPGFVKAAVKRMALDGEKQDILFHTVNSKKVFLSNEEALNHLQSLIDTGVETV